MNPLPKKIHTLMHTDPNDRPSYLESLMFGLSVIYGAGLKIRASGYKSGLLGSKKLPCKVISVGNITAGGTGKTPMTVYLARRIHQMDYRVAVISRGYRGRAEKSGGIVSDGREIFMGPQLAGVEPFRMATRLQTIEVPVLVGQDRYRIGLLALDKFNPDVIILDDGFQHLSLARDINLVLLDNRRPFGNKYLLPRGLLREPISSLRRADIFILTRSDSGPGVTEIKDLTVLNSYVKGRRLYKTTHVPVLYKWIKTGRSTTGADLAPSDSFSTYNFSVLKDRKILAFSGIAKNDDFKQILDDLRCGITEFMGFGDHHAYSDNDFFKILESAKNTGADCLCTTDKDYARMENRTTWPMDLAVIGVEISFGDDESNFLAELSLRLSNAGKAHGLSLGE
jgi:tetraacyldisaccharide 4'-kinase